MFVNDGSKDKTWDFIVGLYQKNPQLTGINLSSNVGHQNALLAGMMTARQKADMIITIDADLQQDIEAIDEFLDKYYQGAEIVYGVRTSRQTDGIFKKISALAFYKFMGVLGVEVMKNHADYRLMSAKALEALGGFKEVNLFLRGLIPMLGFKTDIVFFDVKKREAGESKYTLKKMIGLAIDGITSLSIKPIRIIIFLGFMVFSFSLLMVIYSCIVFIRGETVPGWTSNLCAVWSIGGIQLLSIGVIGEYIGKIYLETKQRPRYIIESIVWSDQEE